MVRVGQAMRERDKEIIRMFCIGYDTGYIDRNLSLADGTARRVVTGWWADDKEMRTGGIETVLGQNWRVTARLARV